MVMNDLDLIDLEVSPRVSAQLSKCLCKLRAHIVTYHVTNSVTFFACKRKKKRKKKKQ